MTMLNEEEKDLVFLFDVDNTLIDNDQVKKDITHDIVDLIGVERNSRFWEIYEQVRNDMDGVNIPQSLFLIEKEMDDKGLYRKLYRLWMDFPYRHYIFPGVFRVLDHINGFATTAILSDGDASFQLRKIVKSGLSKAVDGNILIYLHKEHHFEDISLSFPARHYFMVEDKPSLLAHAKHFFRGDITTVLVQQGKYSSQLAEPAPDVVLPRIADLRNFSLQQFKNGILS